jgi:hypothetical protein
MGAHLEERKIEALAEQEHEFPERDDRFGICVLFRDPEFVSNLLKRAFMLNYFVQLNADLVLL